MGRRKLVPEATYVLHEDHDSGHGALFGPMPTGTDLDDPHGRIWATIGTITVIRGEEAIQHWGKRPFVNPWSDWEIIT